LAEIVPPAERHLQAVGLVLSLEAVTAATVAASAGSAFTTPGPVWHQAEKPAGLIPAGRPGLDTAADWIQSTDHGWVYGDPAPVPIRAAPTPVRAVLSATVTGSACASHRLQSHLDDVPPLVKTLLLEAGDAEGQRLADCAQGRLQVLAPWSKPVGKSTAQARPDRATYLASPEGKARYRQRGCSIEPCFATLKDCFQLDPLPVQAKILVSVVMLLSLSAWDWLVLLNFVTHRPLGQVKPILDLL
jgi:hypothetical protein